MEIEDGEIMESDEELPKIVPDGLEVYTCLERPVAPRPPVLPPGVASDDEQSPADPSSSDSDSDGGDGTAGDRKRRRPAATSLATMDTGHNAAFAEASRRLQARRARLSVWTAVLAEDGITAELASGLGRMADGPRVERDVESYQLPEPPRRPPAAAEGNDGDNPLKRDFRQARQGWRKKKVEGVHLKELEVTEGSPPEQVAADIALKLREEKPEIIANVVRVIGVKKSIELFGETKSVEEGGGMLINNWSRRRTPGGVFIQLLKTDPEVTEEQARDVFRDDRRQQDRERKQVRRRRLRARLARAAAATGGPKEDGERSDDSDSAGSRADSVASAGSGADSPDGLGSHDVGTRESGERGSHYSGDPENGEDASYDEGQDSLGKGDMERDELEVSNEIIFE